MGCKLDPDFKNHIPSLMELICSDKMEGSNLLTTEIENLKLASQPKEKYIYFDVPDMIGQAIYTPSSLLSSVLCYTFYSSVSSL